MHVKSEGRRVKNNFTVTFLQQEQLYAAGEILLNNRTVHEHVIYYVLCL